MSEKLTSKSFYVIIKNVVSITVLEKGLSNEQFGKKAKRSKK